MTIKLHPPIGFCEKGQRANNEDYIFPLTNEATVQDSIFLVCDGVGGAQKGEVASQLACEAFMDFYKKNDAAKMDKVGLQKAINFIQKQFEIYERQHPTAKGMATTFVLLYFHEAGATIAHIGDSRVYHIRGKDILFKTEDHSLVNEWVQQGKLRPEEAVVHPQSHIITRAVHAQKNGNTTIDVHQINENLKAGDYFLLCTDGVTEVMADADITDWLNNEGLMNMEKMDSLKSRCEKYAQDNFSAYLIQIEKVIGISSSKKKLFKKGKINGISILISLLFLLLTVIFLIQNC